MPQGLIRSFREVDPHYRVAVVTGLVVVVLLAGLGTALMVGALTVQVYAQSFSVGNAHWMRGTASAIFHLDRYLERQDPADVAAAREALGIPLGDLRARRALDRSPPELEAARQGLLEGDNAPEDIPGMIRLYRYLGWAPAFERAIGYWRASDEHILRLLEIADELAGADGELGDDDRAALCAEVAEIEVRLNGLSKSFAEAILGGARDLRTQLGIGAAVVALAFGLATAYLFSRVVLGLADRDRRFHATFQQAGVGMAQVGLDGRFTEVNPALEKILGVDRRALVGRRFASIVDAEERAASQRFHRELVEGEAGSRNLQVRLLRDDGRRIQGKVTAALSRAPDDQPDGLIYIVEDVTEAHTLAERLSYQATHDELTGLRNRRELDRQIRAAIDDARSHGSSHVLCYVDLDWFKVVNEASGHMAGDELLRQVARILSRHVRDGDTVARLGGDEFAILLLHCALDDGLRVAEKIRAALSHLHFRWEDRTHRLSATAGVVEISAETAEPVAALRAADMACGLGKEEGRNRVRAYSDSDAALAAHQRSVGWLTGIRRALADDRLVLAAQRIDPLSARHAGALHYEVLVRLRDEEGVEHPPGAFLPPAERFGLITEIDRRVVEKTLGLLEANPAHLERLTRCHLNVSGQSLSSGDFRAFLIAALRGYRVPPEKLCFEVTETAAMANWAEADELFRALGELGCEFALDDFGSGLSSFGYLKHLPVTILKIDGLLVRGIDRDRHDRAIVRAINEMAKALGKATVAEFVESAAVRECLSELGVDFAQGYAIHRPVPIAELMS